MIALPKYSCDSHCHVFEDPAQYPLAASATYSPPFSPVEELDALHKQFGFTRAVLVQGGCYGKDHSALLNAIARRPESRRGVGTVDMSTSNSELRSLCQAGICGARFSFMKHLGPSVTWEDVTQLAARIAQIGWHVDLHVDTDSLLTNWQSIDALPSTVVIDHMARLDAEAGLEQVAYETLCRVLARPNRWVKVSGIDRVSGPNGYNAGLAMARDLFTRFPKNCLWGTDWPHPNSRYGVPSDAELIGYISTIATSEAEMKTLLQTNPENLYQFPANGSHI